MVGFLEGLKVTLKTALRRPVTAQYPHPKERLEIADRYMGFPPSPGTTTWRSPIAPAAWSASATAQPSA